MKLTNNGEMFSANAIEILARNVLNLNAATLDSLESNRNLIINKLMHNSTILVPYDTDANHEPCLKNGRKAHWAIVLGFSFKIDKDKLKCIINDDTLNDLIDKPILNLKDTDLKADLLIKLLDESIDFSLFCKQGKSKHLKLFQFNRLVESNKNLFDVDNAKDASEFVIPKEGISESLCNKFVLISP